MKSRTRKSPVTDPDFAYEMIKRRDMQNERVVTKPYIPRSKYEPNKLPNIIKHFREGQSR